MTDQPNGKETKGVSRFPILPLASLLLGIGLLIVIYAQVKLAIKQSQALLMVQPSQTSFPPQHFTPTPFMPLHPTPGVVLSEKSIKSFYFGDTFDYTDSGDAIEVILGADVLRYPIVMRFLPGSTCNFGEHRACISRHKNNRILLATVHSGVGGEAEALRLAIEGVGVNLAGRTLSEIKDYLSRLTGMSAEIYQGSSGSSELIVKSALRIPASQVDMYFKTPFLEALEIVAKDQPATLDLIASAEPLWIIETCGWRHTEELGASGISDTTGSVYLIVIGEK